MTQEAISDEELERRVGRRALLLCFLFFPPVAAINAATLVTDAARRGAPLDPRLPWLLELTSAAAVPLVILLERRVPLAPGSTVRVLAALAAGSLAFSALHVAGMSALRLLLVPLVLGEGYRPFADPVADLVYEYRKDVFPFAAIVGVLTLSRRVEESRQDAGAARAEARETGRLTLKSGGRTIFLDATATEWARAAGNYVELRVGGQTHLPRLTLAALEEQLRAARVDVVRVHRSHLVNRAMIAEVAPIGDGDIIIRLRDGSEVRGSRRYRGQIGP